VVDTPPAAIAAAPAPPKTAPQTAATAAGRAARTGRGDGTPTSRADQNRPATPEEPKAPSPGPEASPPPAIVPAAPKEILPTVTFAAKVIARDGDKVQERDAKVRLAEGQVTVAAADQTILSTVPYETVLSVIYSKSRQPLWDAPGGAVPIERVQGGAFGFLKGGRHWVSLRMKERFVVLRVEENQVSALLSALEARTGKPPVRITEPAGSR
jgi:hypothetical protein